MKKFPLQGRTLALLAVVLPLLALFVYVVLRSGPLAPVAVTLATVESKALTPALFGVGTGGTRTTSTAATRVSPAALPWFTRTSPLRMMRYTWVLGTPFRMRSRKLSRRWPAESSSTTTC